MEHPAQALPGKHTSLWLATTPRTDLPPLRPGLVVDAVVVGGGIVGLNAAMLLAEAGLSVALIEAGRLLTGVTGHTTAKLTALHGLIYADLINGFGQERARMYAAANQWAIQRYAELVESKEISCDFRRQAAYTYAENDVGLAAIEAEIRAAKRLGLPATYAAGASLPVPAAGAIRLSGQAQFHPLKYLISVAEELSEQGAYIFEQTRALALEAGPPHTLTTQRGPLRAEHVILATHFPFHDPAFYFARLYPKRSYVVALPLTGQAPEGMLYSTTDPYHSVRTHPGQGSEWLLVGGQNHRTGEGGDTTGRYRRVMDWAREHLNVGEARYRWSTQDYVTPDRVPYIGKLSPRAANLWVATGFGGWGMTQALVAAEVIRDAVLGRANDWAPLYDPARVNLAGAPRLLRENLQVAGHVLGQRLVPPARIEPAKLARGQGGVFRVGGEAVAVARSSDDLLHAVSATCPHMGCTVAWNSAEESWDCPCHGSRFSASGEVIHGPALKPLEPHPIEPRSTEGEGGK